MEPWKAEGTEGEKLQHGCTQPSSSSESQIWKLFPEQAGPRVVSLAFLLLVYVFLAVGKSLGGKGGREGETCAILPLKCREQRAEGAVQWEAF